MASSFERRRARDAPIDRDDDDETVPLHYDKSTCKPLVKKHELQASHWSIGANERGDVFRTVASEVNRWHGVEAYKTSAVDEEVVKDLRRSHFVVGNDSVQYSTSNAEAMVHPNVKRKERGVDNAIKAELQKVHFGLGHGEEVPDHYASSTKLAYVPQGAGLQPQDPKLKQELRKAHWEIGGNDPMPQQSITREVYPSHDVREVQRKHKEGLHIPKPTKANFTLGRDKVEYTTNNTLPDPWKVGLIDNSLPAPQRTKSHYSLGYDKTRYTSETRKNYRQIRYAKPSEQQFREK